MEELKIEAIVKFNTGYAYVFNRNPDYKYQAEGNILWAKDGPFYSCYKYETPSGRFQAFAGRKFELNMIDGTVTKCNGQWWDGGLGELIDKLKLDLIDLTMQTREELKKCYVFFGTSCDHNELEKLKSKYYGVVYEYWDYEKVIKFDDMRHRYIKREIYNDTAKSHLILKVKELHKHVKELEDW